MSLGISNHANPRLNKPPGAVPGACDANARHRGGIPVHPSRYDASVGQVRGSSPYIQPLSLWVFWAVLSLPIRVLTTWFVSLSGLGKGFLPIEISFPSLIAEKLLATRSDAKGSVAFPMEQLQ